MIAFLLFALQQPPDPEIERRSFQVADGFEVNLFAADPLLAKPIQMNFDAEGRLWVAASSSYPMIRAGEKIDDKILILEDKDGDGKAETSRVFADGLLIPTGVEPGHGGAYVANSIEILHLKDTDGDGKADTRRVILSGFGTEDTHHIIHTFRWGPEGLFYFNQSIYIHSHVETPHGPRRLGGGGIWRFRPSSQELEVFVRGMCNPWGHTFDRWGQSFGTDGAGGDGIHYLIPGATYPHFPGGGRAFPGLNPGNPKYCGVEIVNGRHLPDDWQGNVITNDFRANRVCRFALSDDGSGFASKQMPDLIKSTDRAFRPIDVKMGPDGAIYIADWFNPIIQHGEVDFFDPRRDRTHGRIWRVTAKGRPLVPRPKLAGASVRELLDQLKAPEDWTRHFAKRVLSERDPKEVLPLLAAWVKDQRDEHDRMEALWLYQALNVVEPKLLESLQRAQDPRARAAATRVASHWGLPVQVDDEHPRVRLEAVRALKDVTVAMRALDKPTDRFLEYALWLTATELKDKWIDRATFDDPRHLEFALRAVRSGFAVGPLVEQIRAGKVRADSVEGTLGLIVSAGQMPDFTKLFEGTYAPETQARVFAALARAARERRLYPQGERAQIKAFFDHKDAGVRAEAMKLAVAWGLAALRPEISRRAEAGDAAAIEALAEFDLKLAARLVSPENVAALIARRGGSEALAEAFTAKPPGADAAKLVLRAMYAAGRQEPALVKLLNDAAGLASGKKVPSAEEVAAKGDPARGEEIFRRKDLSCFACHAIGGGGGQVGPDLASLGAGAPVDYIVESILFPEKRQKEGFVSMLVQTKSGEIVSGLRVRKTDKELVLRDAVRDEIVIPLSSIEQQKEIGSLMPSGLADLLTEGEFLDLVRFLTELGKPGPYAVGTAPAVRRWRVTKDHKVWEPAYSLVSGELPIDPGVKEVQFLLDVTTPGKVDIRLRGAADMIPESDILPRGQIPITLGVGLNQKIMRVEVHEVPGSAARFRIVGGK